MKFGGTSVGSVEAGAVALATGQPQPAVSLPAREPAIEVPEIVSESSGAVTVAGTLLDAMGRAQEELLVTNAYIIPKQSSIEFVRALTRRGVRVRILTNSLASTDVPVVHAGYARHRRALLRAGIELYEMNRQLTPEQRSRIRNSWQQMTPEERERVQQRRRGRLERLGHELVALCAFEGD